VKSKLIPLKFRLKCAKSKGVFADTLLRDVSLPADEKRLAEII